MRRVFSALAVIESGAPERIRTSDPQIRRQYESAENKGFLCKTPLNTGKSFQGLKGPLQTVFDWLKHAQQGDLARVICAPISAARPHYGQPLQPGRLFFLERLLGGADVAIVQSFHRKLIIIDSDMLALVMGEHDDL